jgi:hypothetical protein
VIVFVINSVLFALKNTRLKMNFVSCTVDMLSIKHVSISGWKQEEIIVPHVVRRFVDVSFWSHPDANIGLLAGRSHGRCGFTIVSTTGGVYTRGCLRLYK